MFVQHVSLGTKYNYLKFLTGCLLTLRGLEAILRKAIYEVHVYSGL